ncbi:tripartite motif-containing protein 44 isoform X2 [Poecilia reticulata]|uniref:tripartite motif-containing protein 44 isoform X2 n=1 Tax=Poecilia reticulata TaxID=8081 RepID=UPI0004A4A6FE|nr:PREDICTED: tripartite motif-containing protein 44-like isoform X2 [Poecilia reticulata]
MRFLVPLSVVLVVAAFHSALSASLESAEKEEEVTQYDGLTQLQKIDQMEFDAAQKAEAARMNITEEQSEDSRFLEAVKDGSVEEHDEDESEDESKEGAADSNGATEEGDAESESESSEGTKGRQRREYPETSTLNCVLKGTPKNEMYD